MDHLNGQEQDNKKSVSFSGRTTKGVNPPTTKQKTIFLKNPAVLAQKSGRKRKNVKIRFRLL